MNTLIGKRMLLIVGNGVGAVAVQEYKVLEVSPSGSWVKLQNMNGNKFWGAITEVVVVEELKDLKIDRPNV